VRQDVQAGGVIHVEAGTAIQAVNHTEEDVVVYAYGYPPESEHAEFSIPPSRAPEPAADWPPLMYRVPPSLGERQAERRSESLYSRRRMWRWSPMLIVGTGVVVVVVAAAQGARPLQQRVVRASELPGFKVDSPLEIARSPQAWYHVKNSGRFQDSAALQARGFVVGALEHLRGSGAEALSGVIQFKTPRGAAANLDQFIPQLRSGSYALKRFAVPGIPGAQGAATSTVDHKGFSISFADGRYWYIVTMFYAPNAAKPGAQARVNNMASDGFALLPDWILLSD
jgi:hypothetical protein